MFARIFAGLPETGLRRDWAAAVGLMSLGFRLAGILMVPFALY